MVMIRKGNELSVGGETSRVQLYNPKSKMWVKVDRAKGVIVGSKRDGKPWKNVPFTDAQEARKAETQEAGG